MRTDLERERERSLVERLRRGEAAAVDELAATHGPRVYQLAMRYVKNPEDAEEIVQDVLMKVFRRIDDFRGDAALSSWVHRITFNTAMSKLRTSQMVRHTVSGEAEEEPPESRLRRPEPVDTGLLADDEVLRAELRSAIARALRGLPQLYRLPVILRDIRGLSTEQASAELQIKHQTLKSRLHRGRVMLRERLDDFAGPVSFNRPVLNL